MDGVHLGVHQDQKFCKLDYRFLMKVARHVQSNQKMKLLNVCNILRKSIELLLCFIVVQNIKILYWVSVIFVVTCFWVAVVKNGHGLSDHGTLKCAISQKSELIKRADFLAC